MILVFSGTGNSMFVAKRLSLALGDEIVELAKVGDRALTLSDGRVIWVFPVYSWGLPPVVARWISKVRIDGSPVHYAVMTCGDDTGLTDSVWRKALARRGWTGGSAYSVQMPNTYVLMKGFDVDPFEVAERKILAAKPRIEYIAGRIRDNVPLENDLVRGSFAWIKTRIIYPWFKRYAMSPEPFFATDECVGCKLCATTCPLGNITMCGKRPAWGKDCALCLRCYHICPHHAVAYSTATRGKGQYKLLLESLDLHSKK